MSMNQFAFYERIVGMGYSEEEESDDAAGESSSCLLSVDVLFGLINLCRLLRTRRGSN